MSGEVQPIVWIISQQHWPRALLRAELIERGYQAVGFLSIQEALYSLSLPHLDRPAVLVVELRDLEINPDEVAALELTGNPIILLGGATELANPAVRQRPWRAVISRPFTIGNVADKVEEICRSIDRDKN